MTDVATDEFSTELSEAEKARRIKETIAGPVPLIPEAPDTRVKLPLGLYHNGSFLKEVTLRELTGVDEELLAKQKEITDFFDLTIALGVVSIDNLDLEGMAVAERQGVLRTLLLGERQHLFVNIARVTFGNERVIEFTCSRCDEKQDLTLLLDSDFKPREVEGLDEGPYTFVTSKGQKVTYRLVNGNDQREALGRKGANIAEQNTVILSQVVLKLDGGLLPDPTAFVRSLSMRDRSALLNDVIGKQPEVSMEVTTNCAACEFEQRIALGWGDIFRN